MHITRVQLSRCWQGNIAIVERLSSYLVVLLFLLNVKTSRMSKSFRLTGLKTSKGCMLHRYLLMCIMNNRTD